MKTILYGIFYFFLTLFFAYIFIKEKDLAKKFDVHREKFVNKIVKNENSQISNEKIILSVTGEKEAEKISELEELKNIDILWSSNHARAIGTAKYIAEKNKIEINIDESFNERKLRRFKKFRRARKK